MAGPEKEKGSIELTDEQLKQIVAEADTGGRKPTGFTAQLLLMVALAWSLFQLWIASPLPATRASRAPRSTACLSAV